MKFMDGAKFWATVNKWVRDGSNITAVTDSPYGTFIQLQGKDGGREVLARFFEQEDFDRAEHMQSGD